MNLQRTILYCILFTVYCLLTTCNSVTQTGTYYNQRDDQYRVLGLKRAKEAFEAARKDFDRQKELFTKGLISQAELDRAQANFSDAEVNYQQSLLAVLFEQQYVTISQAMKYQGNDGSKRVRLFVENASGGSAEFRKLLNIDDELFRSLQPDIVNNVYVSLLNNESSVISQPYEAKIAELRFGEPKILDFHLLQDLDAVTVNMIYGNGSQRSLKVFLEKDATVNKVIVQSQQFSQEAELGKTASFDLTLELFGGIGKIFNLEVVNLPTQLNRFFKDPSTQARLSQFKFMENVNTRRAALDVTLPDRANDAVAMDKPIQFFVLVIPTEQAKELSKLQSHQWTQDEIEKLKIGFVKLEILPRGKGRLLVRAQQLFHSIKADESVEMNIELVNEGSRRLDNVEINVDPPLNWTKIIEPTVIPSLEVGEERRVTLRFTPPNDVSVGRFEARIRTTSLSDNQPVIGEDKTVVMEVVAGTNILGTSLLVLLIVGLVAGMVVFGIKLSKR
ncbi:MAG: hypothetical protein HYZ34_09575 [Ignavibacteriae bacterium]|nr:hypothetical protein [Ignavibacteriota bacterium]